MTGADIITAILLTGIFIAVVVYLLYWLYRRSSKEIAFVRTGLGGEKVVLSGGALVLPIVHNITLVGMNTLRLEVHRSQKNALITKNRMRVEIIAEFYLRVRPDEASVSAAAQSLGRRTMDAESLKELVQGRFVDALSTVAAQMTMEDMQESRGEYVKSVKSLVEDALTQNGLELEAVSLTGLDQTDISLFNPSNVFDAEGLTRLTEQIEARKTARNDIEQDTAVQIRNKNLEAEMESLEIEKKGEFARLEQQREISIRRAKQHAEVESDQAEREREAEQARFRAQEEIEKARIFKEKAVEAERSLRETRLTEEIEARRKHRNDVEQDTAVQIRTKNLETEKLSLDIEKQSEFARLEQQREIAIRSAEQQTEITRERAEREREAEQAEIMAHEEVEKTRISQQRVLDSERILYEQETERLEVQRRKIMAVEEKDRVIAIAEKVREQSEVQTTVETARAKEVEAEEKVRTVRDLKIAERKKQIEIILAQQQAEREAIQLTIISAAEKTAAEDRAAANKHESLAAKLRYEVEAEGKRQLNETENMRSDASRRSALRIKLVEHLEAIIRESVKPMENIDTIKILQVEGLPGLSGTLPSSGLGGDDSSGDLGGGSSLAEGGGRSGGSLADNVVSSALRYRAQAPFIDKMLKEIGMSPRDITSLGNLLQEEGDG